MRQEVNVCTRGKGMKGTIWSDSKLAVKSTRNKGRSRNDVLATRGTIQEAHEWCPAIGTTPVELSSAGLHWQLSTDA